MGPVLQNMGKLKSSPIILISFLTVFFFAVLAYLSYPKSILKAECDFCCDQESCSPFPTIPTIPPIGTPTPTPTPTPTIPSFPMCVSYIGQTGDKAHYDRGVGNLHQIIGDEGKVAGGDDVFRLGNGNYLQCFCPDEGSAGIQTNWFRTNDPIIGWFFVNGSQWGLGNFMYAAQNIPFNCDPGTPTPTPSPTPFDICINIDGIQTTVPEGWYQVSPDNYNCRQFQYGGPESSHKDNPGSPAVGGIGGGQVLGTSTMAGVGSFTENLYMSIMILGGTLLGLGIKSYKKA
jgi:hypothetical protein